MFDFFIGWYQRFRYGRVFTAVDSGFKDILVEDRGDQDWGEEEDICFIPEPPEKEVP